MIKNGYNALCFHKAKLAFINLLLCVLKLEPQKVPIFYYIAVTLKSAILCTKKSFIIHYKPRSMLFRFALLFPGPKSGTKRGFTVKRIPAHNIFGVQFFPSPVPLGHLTFLMKQWKKDSMKNIYFDFNVPKRLSEDFVLLMIMHLKIIPALVDVQQLAAKFTQVSWYCCKPFTDVQITS